MFISTLVKHWQYIKRYVSNKNKQLKQPQKINSWKVGIAYTNQLKRNYATTYVRVQYTMPLSMFHVKHRAKCWKQPQRHNVQNAQQFNNLSTLKILKQ